MGKRENPEMVMMLLSKNRESPFEHPSISPFSVYKSRVPRVVYQGQEHAYAD